MPSSILRPALVLATAAAVGILGPLAGALNGPVGQAVGATLSAGWAYAAVSFFSGMTCGTKKGAAALGIVSLWICVTAYYLTKAAQGDYLRADLSDTSGKTEYVAWSELVSMIGLWGVAACLLGPLCGVAGKLARTGPFRLPAQLLLPLVILGETTMRLAYPAPLQDQTVVTAWQFTRMLATVAISALAVLAAWHTKRRRPGARA
ncbi:DUF6518 family protein [Streptomyces sp. NPDC046887]|uniref:DUF6518 family protein n=1 Tax=Streptomyces sp. NPDC046887 TaxID=3155472 RepID=UPI0033C19AE6